MVKRFLLMIAAALMSLCAMSQNQFYVVMKDGSAQSYPAEKVDSLSFDEPLGFKVMGFDDLMKALVSMRTMIDSIADSNVAMQKELSQIINYNEALYKKQIDSLINVSTENEDALNFKIDSLSSELTLVKKYGTELLKKYSAEALDKYGVEALVKYGAEALDKYGVEALDKYGAEALDKYGAEALDKYGVEALDKYGAEALDKYGAEALDKYGAEALDKYGAEALDKYGAEALDKYGFEALDKYGLEALDKYGGRRS